VESEHVEKILTYAAFMNDGIADGIDSAMLMRLTELKRKYGRQV